MEPCRAKHNWSKVKGMGGGKLEVASTDSSFGGLAASGAKKGGDSENREEEVV